MKFIKSLIFAALLLYPTNTSSSFAENNQKSRIGLATLALLNPKFPVSDTIKILKAVPEDRRSFSLAYGIFGKKNTNYKRVMKGVKNKTHVQIYILSSPTRIPRRDGRMEFFFPHLTINDLNRQLPKSKKIQAKYKKVVLNIYNKFIRDYPTVQFTLVPELESTMTRQNTNLLINLTLDALQDKDISNIDFLVNNLRYDSSVKIPIEVHSLSETKHLKRGDSFSMDGLDLSIAQTKPVFSQLVRRGIHFYFWYPKMQGLDLKKPGPVKLPHERTYIIENIPEIIKIIKSAN